MLPKLTLPAGFFKAAPHEGSHSLSVLLCVRGAHPACLQHFHAVENEMDVHLMSWRAVALLQLFVGGRRLASLGSRFSVTDPQLFASDDALVLAPVLGNIHLFDYPGALWLAV